MTLEQPMTLNLNREDLIEKLIADAEEQAAEFAAVVAEDEACGGAMITSTPWAVALKRGPVRAALIEGNILRTVPVKPHLCDFTTMDRAAAERVAALLNKDGDHYAPILVSSMARLCRDHYLGLVETTKKVAAASVGVTA
jgi:hypothetical protein